MNAQELKSFTLEDLNFGGKNYHNFVPQNRNCVWWGDQLVRVESDACYLVNKQNGKETQLFTVSQVNQWAGPTKDIKVRSLRGASFPYADKPLVVINTGERIYTIDFKSGSLKKCNEFVDDEYILEMNAKSDAIAYLKDNNLYVTRGDQNGSCLQTAHVRLYTDRAFIVMSSESVRAHSSATAARNLLSIAWTRAW